MNLDPGIYSDIQSGLVASIGGILTQAIGYSQDLLYLCASLDIVLFALLWVIQGDNALGRLIFTILKIGFLLLVINEFTTWLGLLLSSFGQIAGQAADASTAFELIKAPGEIWQYGYDSALTLLKMASSDGISVGLSLLLTSLGLGLLLTFGLLGARLIVQIAIFYTSALIALLFIPLGALKPTADFAARGLQSVIKSGAALLTLLLVLTLATGLLHSQTTVLASGFNLNQVLGLFFASLVFLLLAQILPKVAADAIGTIRPLVSDNATIAAAASINHFNNLPPLSNGGDLRAATTIDPTQGSGRDSAMAAAVHIGLTPNGAGTTMSKLADKKDDRRFNQATEVAPSINARTLQKLSHTHRNSS